MKILRKQYIVDIFKGNLNNRGYCIPYTSNVLKKNLALLSFLHEVIRKVLHCFKITCYKY